VKAIKDVLCRLPEDLDATYDRILNDIPKEDQEQAHRILQLLASSYRVLTVDEVAEALTINCEEEKIDRESKLRDPSEILEICPSLIEM
jgi:hypothetical protein